MNESLELHFGYCKRKSYEIIEIKILFWLVLFRVNCSSWLGVGGEIIYDNAKISLIPHLELIKVEFLLSTC